MKTAVIVTTYNRPDALAATLDGFFAQHDRDFELLVADDGSGTDTRTLVEDYAENLTPPSEYAKPREKVFEPFGFRPKGAGRPTKKDRRSIEGFFS